MWRELKPEEINFIISHRIVAHLFFFSLNWHLFNRSCFKKMLGMIQWAQERVAFFSSNRCFVAFYSLFDHFHQRKFLLNYSRLVLCIVLFIICRLENTHVNNGLQLCSIQDKNEMMTSKYDGKSEQDEWRKHCCRQCYLHSLAWNV